MVGCGTGVLALSFLVCSVREFKEKSECTQSCCCFLTLTDPLRIQPWSMKVFYQ